MTKKLICLLLALGLTASLAACGGDSEKETPTSTGSDPAPQTTQPAETGSVGQNEDWAFQAGGIEIRVDDDMADVLTALGEPQSYFEAESCAFEGLDKTYTYSGYVITTRPDGDKDYVSSIRLTDDSVATPEGLYIGSSVADVTATYGAQDSATGLYVYVVGNTSLQIITENDAVISIEYLAA